MRVLTLNLWSVGAEWNWEARRRVLRDGIRALQPDLGAFQEAFKTDKHDTAAEIVEAGFHVYHQQSGLTGDGACAVIVSRWPFRDVHEIDQQLSERTADFPATTLIAEIEAPDPIGPVLFVNHLPSWKPQLERERELQTVAAARWIEEALARRPAHVVLAGDLDATPAASSIRFLCGLQALEGLSVYYRDAWGSVRPHEDGHTFTIANPLMLENSDVSQEVSRRIDYIFIRCDDRGPTLAIRECRLAFDRPVDGIWASDHFGVVADFG